MNWSRDLGWAVLVLVVVAWIGGLLIGDDVDVPPIRTCSEKNLPASLVDVMSRLPAADVAAAKAADGCPITTTHECTHFVNSRLSRPGYRGFYMLDGEAMRLPIPKSTRLGHIADAIPQQHRGKTYRTYLIEAQRDWGDNPLYLLDEAAAYINGCVCRRELGWQHRQETDRFAIELLVYSKYAADEIAKRDRDYPIADVRVLLDLMAARARLVIRNFDDQPYADALAGVGTELLARLEADDAQDEE